jgi:uncharacterized protein YjeT (DUF2065 family)
MQLAIQIIGVLIIVEGILFVLKPAVCRKLIAFFSRGRRLYLVGTLRTILAIIFLIASSKCNIPLVIIALGILFLISGIAVFTMRLERQKAILNRWEQKSPTVLRLAAIIALLIGATVVYAA